jgi:hypothetical protein
MWKIVLCIGNILHFVFFFLCRLKSRRRKRKQRKMRRRRKRKKRRRQMLLVNPSLARAGANTSGTRGIHVLRIPYS